MGQELSTYKPSKDPRLTRFFSKLLDEVVRTEADKIVFSFGTESSSSGTIEKAGVVLKTINLKSDWFLPLSEWLGFRNAKYLTGQANSTLHFTGENLLSFIYTSECFLDKRTRLVISGFKKHSEDLAYDLLGIPLEDKDTWKALFASQLGVVLLSSVSQESLESARSLFLSVAGWSKFVSLSEIKDISDYSNSEPVLVTTVGKDILDTLFTVKNTKQEFDKNLLSLVVQHGFVKKTCSGCARKAAPYSDLLKSLPEYLSELNKEKYMIGRGCAACGETGYAGVTGIQNSLFLDHKNDPALFSDKSELELVEILWKQGSKPLLEVGVRKAFAGITTLESVLAVTKLIPQAYVELEKKYKDAKQDEAQSHPLYSPLSRTSKREKPLVLLIEDDRDQLEVLEMVLKDNNYDVKSVMNGREGLDLLEKIEKPDIIISDLMMPVMDGSIFVQNVKANAKFNSVPVLMFTVIADEEKEFELLNLGADDYCEKTVNRKILLKRIENLIKRSEISSLPK